MPPGGGTGSPVLELEVVPERQEIPIPGGQALSTRLNSLAPFCLQGEVLRGWVWVLRFRELPVLFRSPPPALGCASNSPLGSEDILGEPTHHHDHVGIQRGVTAPLPQAAEIALLDPQEDLLKRILHLVCGKAAFPADHPPHHAGEALDETLPALPVTREDAVDELPVVRDRGHGRLM